MKQSLRARVTYGKLGSCEYQLRLTLTAIVVSESLITYKSAFEIERVFITTHKVKHLKTDTFVVTENTTDLLSTYVSKTATVVVKMNVLHHIT